MLKDTDQKLLAKLLQRDEKTLYSFYKDHKKRLFQFILKHLGDSHDSEEVLQDTFLSFIESLRDFRGQSSLKTFLYSIAKNKLVDKLRKKKLRQILFSRIPSSIIESIASVLLDDEIDRQQLARQIETVFSRLPNDYAYVLRLKYAEGYRVAEIAEKLALSFKATESLIFRARKAFAVAYTSYERHDLPRIKKKT